VHERPSDYPNSFVARRHEFGVPTGDVVEAANLFELREKLLANNPGLCRIPREPFDDPVIVEVWF